MRQFKSHIWPPNGYNFKDRDGFVHTAGSWPDLEAQILDYRTRNNMPLGDVHAELVTQVCAGSPGLCYEDEPFVMKPSGDTFNWHVIAWFSHAAGYRRLGLWNKVDDATAAKRAQICATCPKQRALNSACGACITSINGLRKAILGSPSKHQGLSPCLVTWEDCQTTVHLNMEPNPHPDLPAHCWRRPS